MQTTNIKMKGSAVIACFYLTTFVFGEISQKVTYNGNQLWKITTNNKTLLKHLEEEKYLTLWGLKGNKIDAMINADSLDKVRGKLKELGLEYQVELEDIQKAIDESNPKPEEGLEGRKGYRLTWDYYHNLDDIYDYLNYLEQTFPQWCTVRTIGRSFEGRPIKLLKLSNRNPSNKAIFIEGGIHAREWISPASVTYIIHQFVTNYNKEPSYIRNIDWYFVPVLNPDGYEYSYKVERLWRKSRSKNKKSDCIGVDLNRNWGYDWGKNGSSGNPCSNSYRGRRPFSEPETAAVATFFINNPDIEWVGYVAVHAYGQYIVYPWGSPNAVLEDHFDLSAVAEEAAKNIVADGGESYTVGSASFVIYSASGISMDWAKGAQAIKYAFTIELRDKGVYGYILPAKFIKVTSREAHTFVKTIAKAVNV